MSDRIWAYASRGWRVLFCCALVATAGAALATYVGIDGFARLAGTLAWTCALLGVVTGIVAELRRPAE